MVIAARQLATGGHLREEFAVVVRDGRISAVAPAADLPPADVQLPDGILAPGLVDLQVNGFFGVDFIAADPGQWAAVVGALPSTGVTALLPTYVTAPIEVLVGGLRRAEAAMRARPPGARLLGVHLEGPFLSPKHPGAHDPADLCDPTPERIGALLAAAAPGTLALLTLAPERVGGLAALRRLERAGVRVSLGHTDASAKLVAAAAAAGARMVTHLFNAQRGLHHREPGVPGQALVDPRLVSGLILDLHHVAPAVAQIAFAAAGGRIALVTDAVAAAGMPPGTYELGGAPVVVREGSPPRRPDGTVAGAGLRLDEAVGNAVGLGVAPATAIDAASRVPADVLGRADLGRLAPGAAADLVWLGDDFRTRATWVRGELVHSLEETPA